jgi:hypothetical protein
MANELTINLSSIGYLKGTVAVNISPVPSPLTVNCTGLHSVHDTIALAVGDVTLSKGNIVTIGYCYFKNLDVTNTIQISDDGTVYALALKPGENAYCRWNTAAIHAKATAGTPQLEYAMFED